MAKTCHFICSSMDVHTGTGYDLSPSKGRDVGSLGHLARREVLLIHDV
jgi:hypothetical protein